MCSCIYLKGGCPDMQAWWDPGMPLKSLLQSPTLLLNCQYIQTLFWYMYRSEAVTEAVNLHPPTWIYLSKFLAMSHHLLVTSGLTIYFLSSSIACCSLYAKSNKNKWQGNEGQLFTFIGNTRVNNAQTCSTSFEMSQALIKYMIEHWTISILVYLRSAKFSKN